jgi:hypothetical protein
LGFLQDFVDMHTDVEFFCLLNDYELPPEVPFEVPAE